MTRLLWRGALLASLVFLPAAATDVPRPASDLTIPLVNGQRIQLNQYKGKVVALEFLLTNCPGCQKCSQTMEKLFREYGSRGFQPVGVAINQMAHLLVPDYIKQFGLSYPVGYGDRDMAVNFLKHPVMLQMMMPQLVVIDRKGVIRAQYGGSDDFFRDEEKNLRQLVEKLLKEGAETKAPARKK